MQALAHHDPGNLYGLPYAWSTTGIAYNIDKVRERLGEGQFDSWSLLFNPSNAAKLRDCGISILDSPTDVIPSALIYLGKDPNTRDPADLNAAAALLLAIRPFVRWVISVGSIDGIATGDRCLVLGWSGDMIVARDRALAAGNGPKIRYFIPKEGALMGITVMAVPADAPHAKNAARWLNYLMRPEVIADITNSIKFPNANEASLPYIEQSIKSDVAVYPNADTRARLYTLLAMPLDHTRQVNRMWTRFRTTQ
jgi:putrescine transport system substrate-binding protein